jgi:hypothetical protein
VRSYVHNLYRHLVRLRPRRRAGRPDDGDGADRGAGDPFLYFPLRHHFEQNFHVRHRLERYGAGPLHGLRDRDPDDIADAIVAEIGREVAYRPVETEGARRAAALIAELL